VKRYTRPTVVQKQKKGGLGPGRGVGRFDIVFQK
jgi:hypothetical protein